MRASPLVPWRVSRRRSTPNPTGGGILFRPGGGHEKSGCETSQLLFRLLSPALSS
jgi:hypothetical protein